VVDYLNELGVVTIVLGGSQDFSYGICQAFRNDKLFSFCTIDAFLDVKKGKETFNSSNYLSRIFSTQPSIFQFSLLAYQSHYVAKEYFAKTKGIGTHVRLGILREDLSLAEPVFRNSDFLSFDLGTLKHSEAPGEQKLPNGLHNEDACQLAKYAGLSNRLKVFGLFGIDATIEGAEITVRLAAQVAWYFIQGFLQRNRRSPEDGEGFIVNKVEIMGLNTPLTFYKNIETNQWWIEVETFDNKKIYLACSQKDYLDASNNEIPEFWLKYIQKIDGLLK
jgi:arginase family enzyme